MEGLDVVAENFRQQRYQGFSPVGLAEIQVGGQTSKVSFEISYSLDLDLQTPTNNFAPNEYRGVVNPSGLAVYKGSNAREKGNSNCN